MKCFHCLVFVQFKEFPNNFSRNLCLLCSPCFGSKSIVLVTEQLYNIISLISRLTLHIAVHHFLFFPNLEPSGLCAENGTRAPPFGEDLLTGCAVRLAFDNFTDCSNLRTVVEDQQRALVGAASSQTLLVSRFGVPVLTDVTDWVAVTRYFLHNLWLLS